MIYGLNVPQPNDDPHKRRTFVGNLWPTKSGYVALLIGKENAHPQGGARRTGIVLLTQREAMQLANAILSSEAAVEDRIVGVQKGDEVLGKSFTIASDDSGFARDSDD